MAYFADQVSDKIYLYTAGRKQEREPENLLQHDDRFSVQRDLAWCKLDVCFMGSASWCGYGIDKGVETLWGVDISDFEKKRDTAVYQFYMDYLPDSGSERTERSFPCIFKRWDFDQSRPVSVFWNSRKPDWRICDSVQYSASFFCNRNFSFSVNCSKCQRGSRKNEV